MTIKEIAERVARKAVQERHNQGMFDYVVEFAEAEIAAALTTARADGERAGLEKAAKCAEGFGEPYAVQTATSAMMFRAVTDKIASAIRLLKDGTET